MSSVTKESNNTTSESFPPPEKKVARVSSGSRKKRKYFKVEYETRTKLIVRVLFEKASIRKAAKEMGMNFSTAKAIIKIFKEEGRILKKAEQGDYGLGYHVFEKSVYRLHQQHQQRAVTAKKMKAPEDQDSTRKAGKTIMEELARLKNDPNSVITIPQLAASTPLIQPQAPSKVAFNNFNGFYQTSPQSIGTPLPSFQSQNSAMLSNLGGLLQNSPLNLLALANQHQQQQFQNLQPQQPLKNPNQNTVGCSSPQEALLREVLALTSLKQTLMNNVSALQSIQMSFGNHNNQGNNGAQPPAMFPSAQSILRPMVFQQSGAPSSFIANFHMMKGIPQAKVEATTSNNNCIVKVQDQ